MRPPEAGIWSVSTLTPVGLARMPTSRNAIAVWKLDRWGRTAQPLVNDILVFDSAGIRFIAITQGIDTRFEQSYIEAAPSHNGRFRRRGRDPAGPSGVRSGFSTRSR